MPGTRKWLSAASFAAPAALLLFFAFRAGGFFPAEHALVALAGIGVLLLRVTLVESRPRLMEPTSTTRSYGSRSWRFWERPTGW